MPSLPQDVLLNKILPLLDSEKDAAHAFVALEPLMARNNSEEIRYHWIRNPNTTLLKRVMEKKEWARFEEIVYAYPRIVRVRDGRILSEMLNTTLHVPLPDVFTIFGIFYKTVHILMHSCQTPDEHNATLDLLHRNAQRFFMRLMMDLHAQKKINISFIDIIIEHVAFVIPTTHVLFFQGHTPHVARPIINALLHAMNTESQATRDCGRRIFDAYMNTFTKQSRSVEESYAFTYYLLSILDHVIFMPMPIAHDRLDVMRSLIMYIINEMRILVMEDQIDIKQRLLFMVSEAYVYALKSSDHALFNDLTYFLDNAIFLPGLGQHITLVDKHFTTMIARETWPDLVNEVEAQLL